MRCLLPKADCSTCISGCLLPPVVPLRCAPLTNDPDASKRMAGIINHPKFGFGRGNKPIWPDGEDRNKGNQSDECEFDGRFHMMDLSAPNARTERCWRPSASALAT